MENCLVKTYEAEAENNSLNYLGFIRIFVDTTALQSDYSVNFFSDLGGTRTNIVGCFMTNGKTFVNGKTVIEEGDSMAFAPGDIYEVYVPKYKNPIAFSSLNINDEEGSIMYNLNDYEFGPSQQIQSSGASWVNALAFPPIPTSTPNGKKTSGNIENILRWYNPEYITRVGISNSDIEINLSNTRLADFYLLRDLYLNNSMGVGNIRTFLTNFRSTNQSAIISRTNTFNIRIGGTSIDRDIFTNEMNYLSIQFNGTKNVNITTYSILSTILKTYSYNIETDVLQEIV